MHPAVRRARRPTGALRRLALSSALGTMAVGTWATLGAAAAAGATAGSVLRAATAAIVGEGGVHVVFEAHAGSTSTTERILADIGRTSGLETISAGGAHVSVRVTPTHGYVSGNSSGLIKLFGLSAAQAKKVGADWVSWRPGTSQYAALKADVTMASVKALLPKASGTRLTTEDSGGAALYVLRWTIPATGSTPQLSNRLTVSATGAALPVTATSTASGGLRATTTLSEWGEPVLVSPPPTASTIVSAQING